MKTGFIFLLSIILLNNAVAQDLEINASKGEFLINSSKIELSEIPNEEIALPITADIDLERLGVKTVEGRYNIYTYEIKSDSARSLNFLFEDLVIPKDSYLNIYNKEKILLTKLLPENSSPKLLTHLYMFNEITLEYHELKSREGTGNVYINMIGFGLKNEDHYRKMIKDEIPESLTPPCSSDKDIKDHIHDYSHRFASLGQDGDQRIEDFGENAKAKLTDGIYNKAARSVGVMIIYNDGYFIATTATLINTEFCNALILTCHHCMNDICDEKLKYQTAVRFNWFRKRIEDKSKELDDLTLQNKADWLGQLEEGYTDYFGLELLASNKSYEYRLYRMLQMPNSKEHYSGWSTSLDLPQKDDQTINNVVYNFGTRNESGWPTRFITSQIDLDASNSSKNSSEKVEWELNKGSALKGGWSGSAIFDHRSYLIGINSKSNSAFKFKYVYDEIEDHIDDSRKDDIKITDDNTKWFDTHEDILALAGVDADVKFQECQPVYNCKEGKDLNEFISPGSECEPGLCCFEFKYVDPSKLFNPAQNPVLVRFTSPKGEVIGDELRDMDGLFKEGGFKFCIDSEYFENGNDKVIISFVNEENITICSKEISLSAKCLSTCEKLNIDLESDDDCCWKIDLDREELDNVCSTIDLVLIERIVNGEVVSFNEMTLEELADHSDTDWCGLDEIELRIILIDTKNKNAICEIELNEKCCCSNFEIDFETISSTEICPDVDGTLKCFIDLNSLIIKNNGSDCNKENVSVEFYSDNLAELPLIPCDASHIEVSGLDQIYYRLIIDGELCDLKMKEIQCEECCEIPNEPEFIGTVNDSVMHCCYEFKIPDLDCDISYENFSLGEYFKDEWWDRTHLYNLKINGDPNDPSSVVFCLNPNVLSYTTFRIAHRTQLSNGNYLECEEIYELEPCDGDDPEKPSKRAIIENDNNSDLSIKPNPSFGPLEIKFYQAEKDHISIELYDLNGQLISVLFKDEVNRGNISLNYDLSSLVDSGIYFIKIRSSDMDRTMKVVMME